MIELDNLQLHLTEYMASIITRTPCAIFPSSDTSNIDTYEKLLAGAIALRANARGGSLEKVAPIIKAILEWLRSTDFYVAPASTKYHECYPGGLLIHSIKTYNKVCELSKLDSFAAVDKGSSALVALAHDWCKINKYEKYIRHEKDDTTNTWHDKLAYRCTDSYLGLGHGPQSLMMLSRFCTTPSTSLTLDEMAAIRWHMVTYDVTSYDIYDLNNCSKKLPIVLLIQFADQLSICEF